MIKKSPQFQDSNSTTGAENFSQEGKAGDLKIGRRLALHKETLRALSEAELGGVVGGRLPTWHTCTCPPFTESILFC